jgi:S1-C subfamily serine protease
MSRVLLFVIGALFLSVGPGVVRAEEDKKTDLERSVLEGKEIALTPAEIVLADKPDERGLFLAMVKPGKAAMKVKMPAQVYGLGFRPEPVKGGGVKVVEVMEDSPLLMMRPEGGKADAQGALRAEPGDVITHVNGNAVNSVEELLAAVSTAKDKKDVQLVIKDTNSGDLVVVYVTPLKKK